MERVSFRETCVFEVPEWQIKWIGLNETIEVEFEGGDLLGIIDHFTE